MSVEIKWINHASFRIAAAAPDNVLYIDPWKVPTSPADADVVFVSHSHHDHCSPPDIAKVSKADTVILAPAETIMKIGKATAVDPGDQMTIKEITVEAVAAYNIGKQFHPRGHNWCGAVFSIGGRRIYYAGDTDLVSEMGNLTDIDVALLPVGGTYTLNADEAAKACAAIKCKAAIPYHWGDIVGSEADAQAFAKAAPCKVHVLRPGQAMEV
jgi:L-ascorbate metabolism protein UlaG (beta-lactamase superfamily)